MSAPSLEFSIVDAAHRRLWERSGAGFGVADAIDAHATLQTRFPAIRMFLLCALPAQGGPPTRRWLIRNPNLRTATRPADATHGVEAGMPRGDATAADESGDPTGPRPDAGFVEVQLWHRRHLIRHLNYPGLPFATEAPAHVARSDFEPVAEFLAPAAQPLDAVMRLSQNAVSHWLPGQDRRSTSIGDMMVVSATDDAPASAWMVMAMGFDAVDRFD